MTPIKWVSVSSHQGSTTAIDELGRAWRLGVDGQGGPCWCPLPAPPTGETEQGADPELWELLEQLAALIRRKLGG